MRRVVLSLEALPCPGSHWSQNPGRQDSVEKDGKIADRSGEGSYQGGMSEGGGGLKRDTEGFSQGGYGGPGKVTKCWMG